MVKHDKEAIQIITEFVEGKMPIFDFKNQFDTNPLIKKNLDIDPNRPNNIEFGYNLVSFLEQEDINTISGAYGIHILLHQFLLRNGYSCVPIQTYSNKHLFLLKIQPSWLDISDEEFLKINIIDKIPLELKTETKKIKWCKEKIKELFKYEKTPPRWIQDPEWPIINGKPLIFRKQSKETKDDERVQFYFYDPDTKKEVIIEQIY